MPSCAFGTRGGGIQGARAALPCARCPRGTSRPPRRVFRVVSVAIDIGRVLKTHRLARSSAFANSSYSSAWFVPISFTSRYL